MKLALAVVSVVFSFLPQTSNSPTAPSASLTGCVVNVQNKIPSETLVSLLPVSASQSLIHVTRTAPDGCFRIEREDPGTYYVLFSNPAERVSHDAGELSRPPDYHPAVVKLEAGHETNAGTLKLPAPSPLLEIQITDATTGKLIEGAIVRVERTQDPRIFSQHMEESAIRKLYLPPQKLNISITAEGYAAWPSPGIGNKSLLDFKSDTVLTARLQPLSSKPASVTKPQVAHP